MFYTGRTYIGTEEGSRIGTKCQVRPVSTSSVRGKSGDRLYILGQRKGGG